MNSDTVDYDDSCLIVRYLASMRPFAQSFDIYLTQVSLEFPTLYFIYVNESHKNFNGKSRVYWFVFIFESIEVCLITDGCILTILNIFLFFKILRVLGESAIAVRTKAMKCLSEVVAVDPSILARVSYNLWWTYRSSLWSNFTNYTRSELNTYSCIFFHPLISSTYICCSYVFFFIYFSLFIFFLDSKPLQFSTCVVWHAARRSWSFDGQLYQCERGSCGAAGQVCAQQTPTHWTVLRHAHREDTGKYLV